MADFTVSTEVARRTVVRLPTPSNGAELEKALVHAVNLVRDATSSTVYDDSILVSCEDDEILLVIETESWHPEK